MTAIDIVRWDLYEVAESLMDNEIRERLHEKLAPCSEFKFLVEYMKEHKKKYGKDFEI